MNCSKSEANNNYIPNLDDKPKTTIEMVEKTTEVYQKTKTFASTGNVEILFERSSKEASDRPEDKPDSAERREDKFKSTADIKRKPSRVLTSDNIDLKLRTLIPKIVKAVDNVRYVSPPPFNLLQYFVLETLCLQIVTNFFSYLYPTNFETIIRFYSNLPTVSAF